LFDGGIDGLMEQIGDCGFRIADWWFDCLMVGLFDGGFDGLMEQIGDCGFRIADWWFDWLIV
jgi:hypothetical protein